MKRYIPEEIIFNILVWLPANILYNGMRSVWKEWYKIIRDPAFIHEHLLRSNYGIILIQNRSRFSNLQYNAYFVEMGTTSNVQVLTSNLKLWSDCVPLATCNGLVLCQKNSRRLLVGNPTTRKKLVLPQQSSSTTATTRTGIAYVASSRVFKVVRSHYDVKNASVCCEITSVGVDKAWRQVETKDLSPLALELLRDSPYSTGGSVHWTMFNSSFTLAMDAETETFQLHPLPQGYEKREKHYLVMGNSFSFMTRCSNFLWEVWLLAEQGWTKLDNIDLQGWTKLDNIETRFCRPECYIYPVGWLKKNREVVVFRLQWPSRNFIVYVVKTGKIISFQLDTYQFERYQSHLSTLISPLHSI